MEIYFLSYKYSKVMIFLIMFIYKYLIYVWGIVTSFWDIHSIYLYLFLLFYVYHNSWHWLYKHFSNKYKLLKLLWQKDLISCLVCMFLLLLFKDIYLWKWCLILVLMAYEDLLSLLLNRMCKYRYNRWFLLLLDYYIVIYDRIIIFITSMISQ